MPGLGIRDSQALPMNGPLQPKPEHLSTAYAEQFADPSVIAAYRHRPPYPAETCPFVASLIAARPVDVLDIGCGTGDFARPLAAVVDRVDAVDCSVGMVAAGRLLPGGDATNLTWCLGRAEEVLLPRSRYAVITAAESLHWMDWDVLFPRLCSLLPATGLLVLVSRRELPTPWKDELQLLANRYTTNRDFRPYNLVEELEQRGLFEPRGQHQTQPVAFRQPLADYVEAMHSRNGFSRDRMTSEAQAAFDTGFEALLRLHCPDNQIEVHVGAAITWGRCRS